MKIADVLREECVQVHVRLSDKAAALQKVAEVAKQSTLLRDVPLETILKGLKEREDLGSTGFGGGIAIPHCRLESVPDFVVGLLTVDGGVDFDSIDGRDVVLIAFIIGPTRDTNKHIRLLSGISQVLSSPGRVKELSAASSSRALVDEFLRRTRVERGEEMNMSLFHIFVEEEDLFHEILKIMGSIERSSVIVVEGQHTGGYLRKIPLFAGFWGDEPDPSCRVIIAVINKGMANETIRRIEQVTGDLRDREDVMLAVQDVAYCAGGIRP